MKTVFISHSMKDDEVASLVARGLARALPRKDALEVFFDESGIAPGQVWSHVLDRSLCRCEGSVILLSRKALASDWVRTEATILAHHARHRPVHERRVIPVLLDGAVQGDLHAPQYAPLRLHEFQCIAVPRKEGESDAAYAARVIAEVLPSFEGWAGAAGPPGPAHAVGAWIKQICGQLGHTHRPYLEIAAAKLDIQPSSFDTDMLREVLAYGLVNASLDAIRRVLHQIEPVTRMEAVHELARLVKPLWVPHATALSILPALDEPDSRRFVSLAARLPFSPRTCVERATCMDTELLINTLSYEPGEDGEPSPDACDHIVAELLQTPICIEAIRQELERFDAPIFLLIASNLCTTSRLRFLRDRYPRVIFLIYSAYEEFTAEELGVEGLTLASPALTIQDEEMAAQWINRLKLVEKKSTDRREGRL